MLANSFDDNRDDGKDFRAKNFQKSIKKEKVGNKVGGMEGEAPVAAQQQVGKDCSFFRFVGENFQICPGNFSDLSRLG